MAEDGAGAEAFDGPDARGRFGPYGGAYVAETLAGPVEALAGEYRALARDAAFWEEYEAELERYAGRPTPLYFARRLSEEAGGAAIHLKREDLLHTGAHKINNTIGQALLARRMGKARVIAETGAGQHGVATAAAAARLGLACRVYMGARDMVRQAPNVLRMRLLGAEVAPVEGGSATLKDAMNEALRDWAAHVDGTFYVIGSVAGPHPYPRMVRDFQRVIGREARRQALERIGRLPDLLVACVGGGSNAIGLFHPFLGDREVAMVGVEAGGAGLGTGEHAAPLCAGAPGVLHGSRSYLMADEDGQILPTRSVSAGLDYPGVGPEHAWLKDLGRVEYTAATDAEALDAFHRLARLEGIIPALESSHALACALRMAADMEPGRHVLVNLSGRGDKDLETAARRAGAEPGAGP